MMKARGGKVFLLSSIGLLAIAANASAAVDKVICIPWQGDVNKQHTAISGQAVQLKCVVKTTDTSTVWYKWAFGDATPDSAITALSGATKYNVDTTHTYTAATGTPFTAQLLAANNNAVAAPVVVDQYRLKIEDNSFDARVNLAIDRGLWFLYKTQWTSGNTYSYNSQPVAVWSSYSSYYASPTASAVHSFGINNHKFNGNPDEDPYVEAVKNGLNWLLNGYFYSTAYPMLQALTIGSQTYGNPDTNANTIGIQVRDYSSDPPYEGGMVMDAIIAAVPYANRNDSAGRVFIGSTPHTYAQVIQDMVDMYAWGQYDDLTVGGGWRYGWNSWPDNSACQWAAIGMIPAEHEWGLTIPQWAKDRNNVWLNYSYAGGTGFYSRHFGYTGTGYGNNYSQGTRPSGMVQMVMSVPNYKADTRWTGAAAWFADQWTWFMSNRSYYAWYAFTKAMRLSNTETLSSGFDWYRGTNGIASKLLTEQESDGSWPAGSQTTHPGNYGDTFVTAWSIGMLKPTLFQASPVACFNAAPNPSYPDLAISFDPSCSGHSETGKDIHNLISFEWDWNNDGIYDEESSWPDIQTAHSFACATLPCTYPVVLKVTDNSTPARTATYSMDIKISNPPHPPVPVAKAGGPYMLSLCTNDTLTLDGSGSFDPNAGQHQAGCDTCPNDGIIAWDWDLSQPLTNFTDRTGVKVTLGYSAYTAYFTTTPDTREIGLRVTDNTAAAYPGSGQPNLTNSSFGEVAVDTGCICEITARAKTGMVQLSWSSVVGGETYRIYRSTKGPNTGFEEINAMYSTGYPVFVDTNVVNGTTYYYRVKSSRNCASRWVGATPRTR